MGNEIKNILRALLDADHEKKAALDRFNKEKERKDAAAVRLDKAARDARMTCPGTFVLDGKVIHVSDGGGPVTVESATVLD